MKPAAFVVFGLFFSAIAVLAVLAQRLGRASARERAEDVLRAEIDALDDVIAPETEGR